MSVKDYIRHHFSNKSKLTMDELLDIGYGMVNVMTAFNDLKNPKYSNGPCLFMKISKDDGKVFFEIDEDKQPVDDFDNTITLDQFWS